MGRHCSGNRPEEVGLPEQALRLTQAFAGRDGAVQNQVSGRTSTLPNRAIEHLPMRSRVVISVRIPAVGEPSPVASHQFGELEILGIEDVGGWWRQQRYADGGTEQKI